MDKDESDVDEDDHDEEEEMEEEEVQEDQTKKEANKKELSDMDVRIMFIEDWAIVGTTPFLGDNYSIYIDILHDLIMCAVIYNVHYFSLWWYKSNITFEHYVCLLF